jgi:hypothetical protein
MPCIQPVHIFKAEQAVSAMLTAEQVPCPGLDRRLTVSCIQPVTSSLANEYLPHELAAWWMMFSSYGMTAWWFFYGVSMIEYQLDTSWSIELIHYVNWQMQPWQRGAQHCQRCARVCRHRLHMLYVCSSIMKGNVSSHVKSFFLSCHLCTRLAYLWWVCSQEHCKRKLISQYDQLRKRLLKAAGVFRKERDILVVSHLFARIHVAGSCIFRATSSCFVQRACMSCSTCNVATVNKVMLK